jgi:hypothetical protein
MVSHAIDCKPEGRLIEQRMRIAEWSSVGAYRLGILGMVSIVIVVVEQEADSSSRGAASILLGILSILGMASNAIGCRTESRLLQQGIG